MSSGAADHNVGLPTDSERPSYDQRDKPPPYTQESGSKGSYNGDDKDVVMLSGSLFGRDTTEEGFINPGYDNPPQHLQYPQQPQNSAYPQQLSAQYNIYQPDSGGCGPPPNYTTYQNDATTKLPYADALQAMGQQQSAYPTPINYDPVSYAYLPTTAGQYVTTQPQMFTGQPPAFSFQPMLENPPSDYMSYAVCVALGCCWFVGFLAVFRSLECRKAIAVGNRELAQKKSKSALNVSHTALGLGILAYVVIGVIIGIQVAFNYR